MHITIYTRTNFSCEREYRSGFQDRAKAVEAVEAAGKKNRGGTWQLIDAQKLEIGSLRKHIM